MFFFVTGGLRITLLRTYADSRHRLALTLAPNTLTTQSCIDMTSLETLCRRFEAQFILLKDSSCYRPISVKDGCSRGAVTDGCSEGMVTIFSRCLLLDGSGIVLLQLAHLCQHP